MDPTPSPSPSEFLVYHADDGQTRIHVRLDDQTVWLTQLQMAELFQTSVPNVNIHIKNILEDRELEPDRTIKQYLIVHQEGKRHVTRPVNHYNLDMILAVGYRVRSPRGTQFRQWATATLREFLVKGFLLDDQRLKEARTLPGGRDYFDELLARIRDIRASERRFYQKITDIYATSIDYDLNASLTQSFFATVQNKLHFAIHGRTAAEIIKSRADAAKPNMGLTTWKNAPAGPIRKTDVALAKNYLDATELDALNRIVTMYLDYAELQAQRRQPMHMTDWIKKLDAFLQFNEQNILTHAGTISHELAADHAAKQFDQFQAQQRALAAAEPTSDFDRFVEKTKSLPPSAPKPPPTKKRRRRKE
jgi:hypothetical protein